LLSCRGRSGKRFGPDTNKPFHLLLDKPLIVWTLEVFESMDEVREAIPVLKAPDMETGIEMFERYGLSKVKRIAQGEGNAGFCIQCT